MDQVLRRLLAVVLHERDPAPELRSTRELVDPLQEALALLVGRVSLAGKEELDRPERVGQDPPEPLGVGEDEVRPLVGREAARKADRQHRRVQEAPLRHERRGLQRAGGIGVAPQFAHPVQELVLERDVELPELVVRDRLDERPDRLHVVLLLPVRRGLEEVAVVERGDPRVEPGRQVHPVRDRRDGDVGLRPVRPERAEEGARDLAVPLRDRVRMAAEPEREHRHVEPVARRVRVPAQREELLGRDPELVAVLAERAGDQIVWEDVEARRHRGMGGEYRDPPDIVHGLVERPARLDPLVEEREEDKGRVALVQVDGGELDAELGKHPPPADPEHDLLPEAALAVPRVETARDHPVLGRVLGVVRVEEVERDATDVDPPDVDGDRRVDERHPDDERRPVGPRDTRDRRCLAVQPLDGVLLPAVGEEVLVQVPVRVHEPDRDERDVEVGALLEVVAREKSEAAGVERQGVVEAVLGREVGDPERGPAAVHLLEPAVLLGHVPAEPVHDHVVTVEVRRVGRRGLEDLGREPAEEADRVVDALLPERGRQLLEEEPGLGVPRPPEVVGEVDKPGEAFGDLGKFLVSVHDDHVGVESDSRGVPPGAGGTVRPKIDARSARRAASAAERDSGWHRHSQLPKGVPGRFIRAPTPRPRWSWSETIAVPATDCRQSRTRTSATVFASTGRPMYRASRERSSSDASSNQPRAVGLSWVPR